MYSLDINLLSERAEYQTGKETSFSDGTTVATPAKYGKAPLYIGAGLAAFTMLVAGGGWLWTGQQTAQLETKQKALDSKLGSLKVQEQRLQQVDAQIAQVTDESKSLTSVFDRVQPWSAILQDIRESTPQGIQIDTVTQAPTAAAPAPAAPATTTPTNGGIVSKISTPPNPEAKPAASPAPSASPAAPPAPTPGTTATATTPTTPTATATTATLPADVPITKIEIVGKAKSFDEVNNFILTLKQSAFFNPDETHLLSAKLLQPLEPTQLGTVAKSDTKPKTTHLELPKLVDYRIQTSVKRIPSSDLIRELERKGAVGLVTRLRTLQQQQAVKP